MDVGITMTRVVCLLMLVLIASDFTAFASEPLPIGKILEDPQKYHLHVVTLKGIVRDIRVIVEPYFSAPGLKCPGAYTFTLEDKTGSLEVIVRGRCGKGETELPKVFNGERVLLEAFIQAPGHYGGEGLPPLGEDRTTTQAITTKVRILE